jgi:hypothetical protein
MYKLVTTVQVIVTIVQVIVTTVQTCTVVTNLYSGD